MTDIQDSTLLVPAVRVTVAPPQAAAVVVPLGTAPLVMGTGDDCDVVVVDPRVSRRHCELTLTPRGIALRDLGSKNGTSINEISVTDAILPLGATARIGGTRITAALDGPPSVLPLSKETRFGDAVGGSIAMRLLFARLERIAPTSETIVLLGESGTGKEVLAHAIHAASPRCEQPILVFDCSSVAPSLVEEELFGHVRGAFTGATAPRPGLLEQANGSTLFIDEIGELPLDLQPKLLRALEARQVRRVGSTEWRPFDARIIAATHRDLRARVADGSFREDLYYRLAVVELRVPALRERRDDIPLLVERFLAAQSPRSSLDALPPHTMELLLAHSFPGNVRELRNIVTRLVLFPELAGQSLDHLIRGAQAPAPPEDRAGAAPPAGDVLAPLLELPLLQAREIVVEQLERRYLATKLRANGGNVSRTADQAGVSRQLVHRLIERYNLRGADEPGRR